MRLICLAAFALTLLGADLLGAQDTLVVRADNAPAWGESPQLVEEVRIGAIEGDDRYTFGFVAGVATALDGSIWVSDRMLGTLRRYSPAGLHLGDVGRKGQGPGEFNYLMDLRLLPGGSIAVWDPLNTRIHVFSQDGMFERDITVPVLGMLSFPQTFEVDAVGRFYAIAFDQPQNGSRTTHAFWIRLSPQGEISDTVEYLPGHQEGRYQPMRTVTAISPRGYQVWGRNDEYAFFHKLSDGRVVRIERTLEPAEYSRAERSEAQEFEDLFAERNGVSPRKIPRQKPAWVSFLPDSDGRLWVQRHTDGVRVTETTAEAEQREKFDSPERKWSQPLTFDVLEPQGRFLGTLTFPHSASASAVPKVQVALARGEYVWTVERGEFDEQYVVRYRIVADTTTADRRARSPA